MILLISISFPIPFCSLHLSFHSFILSFYRTLYNLYLNPNLLKILSNYIYTIPKDITLHIYILTYFYLFYTPFSILLHTFLSSLLFLYAFPSYFLTFPTHCLTVPKSILLYLG